jgi:glycosyltransferase involved in cell wall biosynthesis
MLLAPTVGVVVANHDNSAFVTRAIDSVARQSFRDIRVVVVDDASNDDSDDVIREHLSKLADARFQYIRLPSNVGQAGSLRSGLDELGTAFVCFLDSDDVWYEDFIARHLEVHLNADFPVAMTYCDSHVIDADDRLLAGTAWWFDMDPFLPSPRPVDRALVPTIDPGSGEITYRPNRTLTLYSQWSPDGATNTTASMMFRRSFVDLVLVPPNAELRLYVDFYLATFACLLTGAIAIHEALYGYRMHGLNKHSDAAVLGGAYNSSKRPWRPIRTGILKLIRSVMLSEAENIRQGFGDQRYGEAQALVSSELDKLLELPSAGNPATRLLGKAVDLIATGLGNGRRKSARSRSITS